MAQVLDRPAGLVITRLGASGVALITSPIIARAIGPEGRGLTAAAITTLMILPIALGLGLPWAVRQRAAVNNDFRAILRSARILSFIPLAPTILIGMVLSVTLFSDLPRGALIWLMGGLILTPFIIQRNSAVSVFVVKRNFLPISIINIAQPICFFVAILTLAIMGHLTVTTVVASQAVSMALGCVVTMPYAQVGWRGVRYPFRDLANESLLASGAQISEIASHRLNQLILLPVIGSAALGFYSVAANVALAPAPVGQAISSSVFAEVAQSEGSKRRQHTAKALKASFSLAFVIASIIALLSPLIIPLVFGAEFRPAVPATIVLSGGAIFVICNFVLTSCLVANGRSKSASAGHFMGFLVGLVLLFALGIPFGLTGAAVASTVGFLVTSVYSSYALSMRFSDWIPRKNSLAISLRMLTSKG